MCVCQHLKCVFKASPVLPSYYCFWPSINCHGQNTHWPSGQPFLLRNIKPKHCHILGKHTILKAKRKKIGNQPSLIPSLFIFWESIKARFLQHSGVKCLNSQNLATFAKRCSVAHNSRQTCTN